MHKSRLARRRTNAVVQLLGYFGVAVLFVLFVLGGFIYRGATFNTATITPTSYQLVNNGESNVREVFALEGEYRIQDTWIIPHNRSSGAIANSIDQAVKLNNASQVRDGSYSTTCDVKTWGVRFGLLSMYPHIYEVNCR